MNVTYSCTYGFLVSTKKMLIEPDAFFVRTDVTPVVSSDDSKPSKIELIIPLTLAAVAVVCLIVLIIVKYCRQKSDNPNQKENEESSAKNVCFQFNDELVTKSVSKADFQVYEERKTNMELERFYSFPDVRFADADSGDDADLKLNIRQTSSDDTELYIIRTNSNGPELEGTNSESDDSDCSDYITSRENMG